jgi:hypothetical protein
MALKSGIAGDKVTVTGSGIYNHPDVAIYFNSILGGKANVVSGSLSNTHDSVDLLIPNNLPRDNTLILYNGVNYASGTGFRFIDVPNISSFGPQTGAYWGESASISGSNFINVSKIKISEQEVTNFSVQGETGASFIIPPGTNSGPISIFATGGSDSTLSGQSGVGFTGFLDVRTPPTLIHGFSPEFGNPGTTVFVSGISLHDTSKIEFSGRGGLPVFLNNPISSGNTSSPTSAFTGIETTGIIFNIPHDIKAKEKFKLLNITGGQIHEETQSPNVLHSVYTGIDIISPTSGKYQDIISVSGTELTGVEFLFKGYWPFTGESTYIAATEKTFVDGTGAYIKVPREICFSPILISGENVLEESNQNFQPLPTISGIEVSSLIVGEVFRLTGVNAGQAAPLLGVTGNSLNGKNLSFSSHQKDVTVNYEFNGAPTGSRLGTRGEPYSDHFGNIGIDISMITGDYPNSVATGLTIITGIINNTFIGSGFPFLVPDNQIFSRDFHQGNSSIRTYRPPAYGDAGQSFKIEAFIKDIASRPFFGILENITGEAIEISGRAPEISGITPLAGNENTLISIKGSYFNNATGVKITSNSNECIVSSGQWVSGIKRTNPHNYEFTHDYINYIGINFCTGFSLGTSGAITILDYHHKA